MQNFPSSLSSAVPTNNQKQLQTIVDNLNKMRAEQRTMSQKLSEIEADATEHRYVKRIVVISLKFYLKACCGCIKRSRHG